jgi:pentatricopeptide repeat domain-containing protein 1
MANGSGSGQDIKKQAPAIVVSSRQGKQQQDATRSRPSPSPHDMDTLKAAIEGAKAGTGQVRQAIKACSFQPRLPAFTTLIQQCARARSWDKAFEVFEAMKETDVQPNVITYSCLISAAADRWEQALALFREMQEAAKSGVDCKPNLITFSALISSCARGGRLDKALEIFEEMQAEKIEADTIIYSALLSGCEKAGQFETALRLLEEAHAAGSCAMVNNYDALIRKCGEKENPEKALELFLEMQMAAVEPARSTCLALLSAFEAGLRARQALQLIEAMQGSFLPPDAEFYNRTLVLLVKRGLWQQALTLCTTMVSRGVKPDSAAVGAAVSTTLSAADSGKAAELIAEFQKLGVSVVLPIGRQ